MTKRIDKATEIAKSTMTGDLRDAVLDIISDRTLTGKSWKDMNEADQRRTRDMIVSRIEPAVDRAVNIIASEGRRHVKVLLKSITVKDGIKGSFEAAKTTDLRHELIDAQGDMCLVVLTGTAKYIGERAPVKIDKDQPDILEESDEDDEEEDANEDDDEDEDE